MKSISTINPAITKNTKNLIVKMHTPVIKLKVGVLLDRSVLLLFIYSYFKHFG